MKSRKEIKEIEPFVINEYINNKIGCVKISRIYGINSETVLNILKRNGVSVNKRIDENKINDIIIEYINNRTSINNLAKKYNIGSDFLSRKIKERGIKITNHQNVVRFNENIFDYIDTEEKAYWLGFIYADGYISNRDNRFELALSLHDIEHLRKFAKFMGYENNIKQDSYRCRFYIRNKHLWNTLNSYGCTPKKSLTLEFPDERIFKSKDLIRHFIRGYFDGDGCVSYYTYKSVNKLNVSCLGTKSFLENIIKYAKIKCIIKESRSQAMMFNLSLNKSILFCEYIYNNCSIYLDRKYLRYFYLKDGNCRSIKELVDY